MPSSTLHPGRSPLDLCRDARVVSLLRRRQEEWERRHRSRGGAEAPNTARYSVSVGSHSFYRDISNCMRRFHTFCYKPMKSTANHMLQTFVFSTRERLRTAHASPQQTLNALIHKRHVLAYFVFARDFAMKRFSLDVCMHTRSPVYSCHEVGVQVGRQVRYIQYHILRVRIASVTRTQPRVN